MDEEPYFFKNLLISGSTSSFFVRPHGAQMPGINTIAVASKFQTILDEVMIPSLTSGWMDRNSEQAQYMGCGEVKIPKISMSGLGDYDRKNGFPGSGAVSVEFETRKLTKDRAQLFQIDEMDVDESGFIATASNVMGQFQRTKVAPEIDAFRYSSLYARAAAASKTLKYTAAAASIFAKLKDDILSVQDIVGESEPLIITMSMPTANILDQADQIKRQLSETEMKIGNVSSKVKSLDGIPIIKVPSARMRSAYTFSATNGFSATDGAEKINWIITAERAPIGITKQDAMRIFDPQTNQKARAWQLDYRRYHDLFVADNKLDGIFANYEEVA
jgi:hypothetical protein